MAYKERDSMMISIQHALHSKMDVYGFATSSTVLWMMDTLHGWILSMEDTWTHPDAQMPINQSSITSIHRNQHSIQRFCARSSMDMDTSSMEISFFMLHFEAYGKCQSCTSLITNVFFSLFFYIYILLSFEITTTYNIYQTTISLSIVNSTFEKFHLFLYFPINSQDGF